jgi:hypothetical protein
MKLTPQERGILRRLGQQTGAAGGRKAAANMTKAERVARARKAARARYNKGVTRKEARHGKS